VILLLGGVILLLGVGVIAASHGVSRARAAGGSSSAAAPRKDGRAATEEVELRWFFLAVAGEPDQAEEALGRIAAGWRPGYAALLVDLSSLLPPSRYGRPDDPGAARDPEGARVRRRLIRFLEEQTGNEFRDDLRKWWTWLWQRPYQPHERHMSFKATLYQLIDERMAEFFPAGGRAAIRLDEILWGGVKVNGIPPLDHPSVVTADEAGYLAEDDVVFGVVRGGETRAYPKRILAWHELARDRVGGVELTVVYCTLCGTVIPYDSVVGGERRVLGTSGLLYRSNKLMFDGETHSLWSTITGTPVVGELVGSGLRLRQYPVVTTSWGEWRRTHPDTTVLSLETGHDRDYAEGAAYREYFATDDLMFPVSRTDERLANKAEVLVVRPEAVGSSLPGGDPAGRERAGRDAAGDPPDGEAVPLAISVGFLSDNPLYEVEVAGSPLIVITSSEGASRVYERGDHRFVDRVDPGVVEDARGRRWRLTEEAAILEDDPSVRLLRVPAHRAFWFGWYAQYPETRLVH